MTVTQAVEEAVTAFAHEIEAIEKRCRELEQKARAQEEALNEAQKVELLTKEVEGRRTLTEVEAMPE